MIESLKKITFNKEMGIVALFLSLFLILKFFGTLDFSLTDSSKLYISQATKDGIDVSKRVSLFFRSVISLSLLFPTFYYLLNKIQNRFSLSPKRLNNTVTIAFIGILLIVSKVYGVQTDFSISLVFSLFILCFTLSFVVPKSLKGIVYQNIFPVLLILSFIGITALLLLLNVKSHFPRHPENVFFFVFAILSIGYFLFKKYTKMISRSYIKYFLPLAFIPLFLFISIESVFYFKLNHGQFIPYKKLFIGLIILTYVLFFTVNYFKKITITSKKALTYFFVPSAIVCFALLTIYHPFIEQPSEIFELANVSNSIMKIFQFQQIPFVDFMSSHMFSEQFYGILYTSIFGYDANMGFLSYHFFYLLIFYFLIYSLLLRLFGNPILILLFIFFFPFLSNLFHVDLLISIVAFFAWKKCLETQSIKNYLLVAFTLLFLIFWRLDTGAATLFAFAILIPLSFWMENKKVEWLKILKASALVILVIVVVTAFFIQIRSADYILNNLRNALHYTSANQAHGYSALTNSINQQFVNLHFLLPLIAVVSSFFSVYFLKTQERHLAKTIQFSLSASLFFYLIYLTNFHRGLVRHSFIENTDYYLNGTFFIALALFILSFFQYRSTIWRFISFTGVSFLLLVFIKYFPLPKGKSAFEKLITENTLLGLDTYFNEENFKGRAILNDEFADNNYRKIDQFLNENIEKDQTFFDFSNTPALYYYTNRNVPFYFCQNLQNSVDDYLQLKQIAQLNKIKAPVVIYSNYPESWYDASDDVPNAMRYYLLAEYVYLNYKPFEVLNKHSIWVSNKGDFKSYSEQKDTICTQAKTYAYKKAALFISEHFEKNTEKLKLASTVYPVKNGKTNYTFFDIPKEIQNSGHVFVKVITKNNRFELLKLEILDGNEVIGVNTFQIVADRSAYMTRLTNHYLWHTSNPDKIRIRNKSNIEILKLEFFLDER